MDMSVRSFAILFVSCLTGYNAVQGRPDIGSSGYGAVVDAGSSSTKLYVYKWEPEDWTRDSLPNITLFFKETVRPGVSSYAWDEDGLTDHVVHIMHKLKETIPEEAQEDTPLLFMATAGLRLLAESKALEIIEDIEHILDDATINPFWHDASSVRILSGEGEGSFSWLAVNYLEGIFENPENLLSAGVLEVGGASSQITFLPLVDPLADKFPMQILGKDYGVYTHSYLGYGQDAIVTWIEKTLAQRYPFDWILTSPCMIRGHTTKRYLLGRRLFFYGSGEPEKCDELLDEYFSKQVEGSCNPKPCGLGAVYQPSFTENITFYGMGVYLYVARGIGLIGDDEMETVITPQQYRDQAFIFCARVREEMGNNTKISHYCSSALMIHKLLTRGFNLNDYSTNLRVIDSVHGTKISWTLGALIYELEKMKCRAEREESRTLRLLMDLVEELDLE